MTRQMKISLGLALLIFAAAACYHWQQSQQLAVIRENYTQLAAQAATFGVTLDSSRPSGPARVTRRTRENKEVDIKAIATELIALAKKMEAAGDLPWSFDANQQKGLTEIMSRLISLDSAQLQTVIAEVGADKDLQEQTRWRLIGYTLNTLASEHPQVALALLTESPDFLKDIGSMGESVVTSSLVTWAKDDAMAALGWVRKNGGKFPSLVTDDTKQRMISSLAADDPKLALKLIGEFKIKDASDALFKIASAAKTPGERTTTLATLRDCLAAMPDEKARNQATEKSVGGLARGLAEDGFTAATQWIAGANFTPTELESIAANLSYCNKSDEVGQWIDWISEKFPVEKSGFAIPRIVEEWTQKDYQAAGKWLSTTPASPTKNAAIRSYAETVSAYDPATATQWAMTLPPGPDRDATLKHIQDHSK